MDIFAKILARNHEGNYKEPDQVWAPEDRFQEMSVCCMGEPHLT
jgi:hypothetical protein